MSRIPAHYDALSAGQRALHGWRDGFSTSLPLALREAERSSRGSVPAECKECGEPLKLCRLCECCEGCCCCDPDEVGDEWEPSELGEEE